MLNPSIARQKPSLEPDRQQVEEQLYVDGLLRPGRRVDDSAVEQFLEA
jgi:hypothetical protein